MAQMTPAQIKVAFAKGRKAREAGRLTDALSVFAKLRKAAPGLAEVPFNEAEIYGQMGRVPEAAKSFEAALALRPKELAIWVSYLKMASRSGHQGNFAKLMVRARKTLGGHDQLAQFEALLKLAEKDHPTALSWFEVALDAPSIASKLRIEYGRVLDEMGRGPQAIEQFDAVLDARPKDLSALHAKAETLRAIGEKDAALAVAQRVLEVAPRLGASYGLYSSIMRFEADDPIIGQMERLAKQVARKSPDYRFLNFALAKAMEETGQVDKVFIYLDRANASASEAFPYDLEGAEIGASKLQALWPKFSADAISDAAPIFVTGAPRSGTTLVERILAAHSRVEAGGELAILQPKLADVFLGDTPLKEGAASGEVARFKDILERRFPDTKHVTDKSISSYSLIGYLLKLMPKAKVVVVRRDPGDLALSIYKNQFRDGLHRYSTDLKHIAHMIRSFEAQVAFWRDACPGQFHEISYEDLVADTEQQSRVLLDQVALDWEPACLEFYKAGGAVRTLSSSQVRQPIYSSSSGAWRAYEAQLKPFWDAYSAG